MSRSATGYGGLCERCLHGRVIVSDRGSRFLLCARAKTEPRFTKYPPQPVVSCSGWEEYPQDASSAEDRSETGGASGEEERQ